MTSNYNLEINENYISLTLSGKYDFTLFLTYSKKLKEVCDKTQITKVLINSLNVDESEITASERQFIGVKLSADTKQELKIASVWKIDELKKIEDTNELIISEKYRIFSNIDLAVNWLLSI